MLYFLPLLPLFLKFLQFSALLNAIPFQELRSAFRKHNLLLTAAFGAGKDTIDIAYDVEGLSIYLDFIHMMCYDYHGAWDLKTGANAPLHSDDTLNVEYSINYMLKLGAPAKKLVLGIPLYGRTYLLTEPYSRKSSRKPKLGTVAQNLGFQGPYTRENGFMGYNEVCMEFKNSTWTKFWDAESRTPFAVKGNKVIAYDDVKSIEEKVKFAMEKDLAGVMVWSIDTDDFHGDCSDMAEGGHFENYPLMRGINSAVEKALNEITRDRENVIVHGKERRTGGATKIGGSMIFLVFVIVCLKL